MKVTPRSDKEISESNLMPDGIYSFEVKDAQDSTSAKGNAMTALVLDVFDNDGVAHFVRDWLVETDGGAYKIKHFAKAVGMLKEYEAGNLDVLEMYGKTGKCKIGTSKDKTGQYPDKNTVKDYVEASVNAVSPAAGLQKARDSGDLDDEIPF